MENCNQRKIKVVNYEKIEKFEVVRTTCKQ